MTETITANGMRLPKLGLGIWGLRGNECRDVVAAALATGYRHLGDPSFSPHWDVAA